MSAVATGVGSLPGVDVRAAAGMVADELPDFVHLPELPDRGPHAVLTGRAVGLLAGLGADLQPAGWRLTGNSIGVSGGGLDQRRARSLLGEDLDVLEEHTQGYDGRLKVQVCGPWTFAATVERPRGDLLLADHGARREVGESLAQGVADHVADLRRRVPGAALVVQVDEPALPSVLAAALPTASGFGRHRSVAAAEASAGLSTVLGAAAEAGARPVVHCCHPAVPVALLAGAGVSAVSLDVGLLGDDLIDPFAAALDDGVELWPGVPESWEVPDLLRLYDRLGLDPHEGDRDGDARPVITPTCGLAAVSWPQARETYRRLSHVARQLSEAG